VVPRIGLRPCAGHVHSALFYCSQHCPIVCVGLTGEKPWLGAVHGLTQFEPAGRLDKRGGQDATPLWMRKVYPCMVLAAVGRVEILPVTTSAPLNLSAAVRGDKQVLADWIRGPISPGLLAISRSLRIVLGVVIDFRRQVGNSQRRV